MQYDVNNGLLQVVIEGEEINAVVGEAAQIDVGEAINYIQTGTAEIEQAVQEGIIQFNGNATEKTNEFDLNAQNKTSDFNSNATQKTLDFNSNASDKTSEFNLNAQDKTSDFNANAVEKTNDFNSNAQDKTGDFNDNAVDKTNDFNDNASDKTGDFNDNAQNKTSDFNDNYTEKKGLIDAQVVIAEGAATTATNQAGLAKQWAIGDPTEPVGNSSKYWAEYAERIAEGIGDPANRDLSNLTETGNNRFVNLQNQIDAIVASSDVFDIVATYAALQAYDITTVPVNDIVKVLVDETHSGAATYYRCVENGGVKSWSYIGSEGAYYTKGEADVLLAGRANTDLSNLSTTGQAVLDAKQDVATAVNYDNISNCITEIPQDIKLELSNGTLTLKAGSKVTYPDGTQITISTDETIPTHSADGEYVCVRHKVSGEYSFLKSLCYSGTTAPTGFVGNAVWFDTTNNIIKNSVDSGATWENSWSLPVGIVTQASGAYTSIDQVFNGFGYIGSTVFALPGVKGLIPNGRNADGTLKNAKFTINNVSTATLTTDLDYYLRAGNNYVGFYLTSTYYDEKENLIIYNNEVKMQIIAGKVKISGGKITLFEPKTAFHAVDYNDYQALSNKVDTNTSNIALKQDIATAVNYDNISNCITEIPQDIKLELNNGTLTLKAGSKFYIPNGFEADGTTPKFDVYTIPSDLTRTADSSYNDLAYLDNNHAFDSRRKTTMFFSGSSAPSGETYMVWYDTTNNIVKKTDDGGSTWVNGCSLPFAEITSISGQGWVSIDQVFNGFGYIGSTIFALPGVKGLIPNGRNDDGSLKNNEFTISNVLTEQLHDTIDVACYLHYNSQNTVELFTWTDTLNQYVSELPSNPLTYGRYYNITDNLWYYYDGSNWYKGNSEQCCYLGKGFINSNKYSGIELRTAFHAVDYNDIKNNVPAIDTSSAISRSLNTPYMATRNCWVYHNENADNNGVFYVNGVEVYRTNWHPGATSAKGSALVLVKRGQTWKAEGGNSVTEFGVL